MKIACILLSITLACVSQGADTQKRSYNLNNGVNSPGQGTALFSSSSGSSTGPSSASVAVSVSSSSDGTLAVVQQNGEFVTINGVNYKQVDNASQGRTRTTTNYNTPAQADVNIIDNRNANNKAQVWTYPTTTATGGTFVRTSNPSYYNPLPAIAANVVGEEQTSDDFSNTIPGTQLVDFPIYSQIPQTQFSCSGRREGGYYADVQTNCQVYHVCALNTKFSFLCPNGTKFDQKTFVCNWWYNVDCNSSANYFSLNDLIGVTTARPLMAAPLIAENQQLLQPSVSYLIPNVQLTPPHVAATVGDSLESVASNAY